MMQETLLTGTARKAEISGLDGRRQDRHQPGFPRRLVHRLHRQSRHRRLARQRRQLADQEGDRRRLAGRSLDPLHAHGPSGRAGGRPAELAPGRLPLEPDAGRIAGQRAAGAVQAQAPAPLAPIPSAAQPAGADARIQPLRASGSGRRTRWLAGGSAVRTVDFRRARISEEPPVQMDTLVRGVCFAPRAVASILSLGRESLV